MGSGLLAASPWPASLRRASSWSLKSKPKATSAGDVKGPQQPLDRRDRQLVESVELSDDGPTVLPAQRLAVRKQAYLNRHAELKDWFEDLYNVTRHLERDAMQNVVHPTKSVTVVESDSGTKKKSEGASSSSSTSSITVAELPERYNAFIQDYMTQYRKDYAESLRRGHEGMILTRPATHGQSWREDRQKTIDGILKRTGLRLSDTTNEPGVLREAGQKEKRLTFSFINSNPHLLRLERLIRLMIVKLSHLKSQYLISVATIKHFMPKEEVERLLLEGGYVQQSKDLNPRHDYKHGSIELDHAVIRFVSEIAEEFHLSRFDRPQPWIAVRPKIISESFHYLVKRKSVSKGELTLREALRVVVDEGLFAETEVPNQAPWITVHHKSRGDTLLSPRMKALADRKDLPARATRLTNLHYEQWLLTKRAFASPWQPFEDSDNKEFDEALVRCAADVLIERCVVEPNSLHRQISFVVAAFLRDIAADKTGEADALAHYVEAWCVKLIPGADSLTI